MVSPDVWLEILAWVKTLFDLTKSTVDLVDLERTHEKYRRVRKRFERLNASAFSFRRFPKLRSSRYWTGSRVAAIGSSRKEAALIVHAAFVVF
ncbi:MAG: hypothetical protein ACYDCA_01565 [Candidatus Tyrphobacter sp.]